MKNNQLNVNDHEPLPGENNSVRCETSYRDCFLSSVWQQSRLIASLLDQAGLPYHHVFRNHPLELFLFLINTELATCRTLESLDLTTLSTLSDEFITIQLKLISSMDLIVVNTLKYAKQEKKQTPLLSQFLGKHHQWKTSAQARFNQVICPVLESKFCN